MRDIGKNIKDLRMQRELTQDALAERLFVTRQTVSNYETGKSRPDIDMLLRIAETLEVDIHRILYGPQPRDRKPLIRLAVAAGLTLVLGILWTVSRAGRETEYYNFAIGPMSWIYSFSQPFFFTMLGWTLAQGIAVLTKAHPPRFAAAKWLRPVLLALVVLWAVFLISSVVGPLRIPGYWVLVYSLRYPWLLLFPGIGLWLCGFPFKR